MLSSARWKINKSWSKRGKIKNFKNQSLKKRLTIDQKPIGKKIVQTILGESPIAEKSFNKVLGENRSGKMIIKDVLMKDRSMKKIDWSIFGWFSHSYLEHQHHCNTCFWKQPFNRKIFYAISNIWQLTSYSLIYISITSKINFWDLHRTNPDFTLSPWVVAFLTPK